MDFNDFMAEDIIRKSKKYIIYGDPIPLARPRFVAMAATRETKPKVRVYDSQKADKRAIAYDIKKQHGKEPMFEGPLFMELRFYMLGENTKHSGWHYCKPDLSNLIKMYEDVCSGILYRDDAQISSTKATKEYASGEKRTEIVIHQLENMNSGRASNKEEAKHIRIKKANLRF